MRKLLGLVALMCCMGCEDSERILKGEQVAPIENTKEIESVKEADDEIVVLKEADMSLFPNWFKAAFVDNGIADKYKIGAWMEPYFLTGDFDGDGKEDVVFLAENKVTNEKGLIVTYQGKTTFDILGAGIAIEEMTNLYWIGIFEKVPAGEKVAPTLIDEESGDILGEDTSSAVTLKTDGIFIHQYEECGGGVIYRVNDRWEWIQIE